MTTEHSDRERQLAIQEDLDTVGHELLRRTLSDGLSWRLSDEPGTFVATVGTVCFVMSRTGLTISDGGRRMTGSPTGRNDLYAAIESSVIDRRAVLDEALHVLGINNVALAPA